MAQLKSGKGQLTVPGRVEWVAAVGDQAAREGYASTAAYLDALVAANFARTGRTPPVRKLPHINDPWLSPRDREAAR